jgi:hypothetical protein
MDVIEELNKIKKEEKQIKISDILDKTIKAIEQIKDQENTIADQENILIKKFFIKN